METLHCPTSRGPQESDQNPALMVIQHFPEHTNRNSPQPHSAPSSVHGPPRGPPLPTLGGLHDRLRIGLHSSRRDPNRPLPLANVEETAWREPDPAAANRHRPRAQHRQHGGGRPRGVKKANHCHISIASSHVDSVAGSSDGHGGSWGGLSSAGAGGIVLSRIPILPQEFV